MSQNQRVMSQVESLQQKDYAWALIKKDPERLYQLTCSLADKVGGMEAMERDLKDDTKSQKFRGIKDVFNEECWSGPTGGRTHLEFQTKFEKGFSRFLNSAKKRKGTGRFYNTYSGFKQMFQKWKRENANQVTEDDFSGLESLFSTNQIPGSASYVELLMARAKGASFTLPDGTEVKLSL
tara:strand:+ start:44 stop:583 length:540 start_codon:yes stop_codon:yes gene_type:complete